MEPNKAFELRLKTPFPRTAGAILIEDGTLVPDSLSLDSQPYSSGWGSLRNPDRRELDRELHRAGWTFFSLADEIKRSVFGFSIAWKSVGSLMAGTACRRHGLSSETSACLFAGSSAAFTLCWSIRAMIH